MIHEEKTQTTCVLRFLAHRCGQYNRQCSRQDLLPSAAAAVQKHWLRCRQKRPRH